MCPVIVIQNGEYGKQSKGDYDRKNCFSEPLEQFHVLSIVPC